ncbi:aldehyde dehydrogenase family protein [Anaerosporobacter sp.]
MKELKNFTQSFKPASYSERISRLEELKRIVETHEADIVTAINNDLNRSNYETLMAEIYPFYKEINYFIKHLKVLMKPHKVKGNIATFGSKNYIEKRPYGFVAVISPWNYPFQLGLVPIVGAIAAGNKVILKPSEISTNTSNIIVKLFQPLQEFMLVVDGGVEETTSILNANIDYVFFTGSTKVGKIIMKSCAENLIPHTLELGGKSPCIVENSANFTVAAKRLVWGKLFNAGQTCIAPDYVLVREENKEKFVETLITEAKKMVAKKERFTKIISQNHYNRLLQLLQGEENNFIYQQKIEEEQTLGLTILSATKDSAIMKEEIFGPILPILTYKSAKEAVELSHSVCKNPLSLYVFTNSKQDINFYSKHILSGGMCVNDVIMHFNNDYLPFGGVGQSGIGSYHGKYSFDTFSHARSVLVNLNSLRFDVRYQINDTLIGKLKYFLTK